MLQYNVLEYCQSSETAKNWKQMHIRQQKQKQKRIQQPKIFLSRLQRISKEVFLSFGEFEHASNTK